MRRKVFISYAHEDREAAEAIRTALLGLEREGRIDPPWMDRRSLVPGEVWSEKLWDALDASDIVLACVSADYISSEFCTREWSRALAAGATVVPCLLSETEWKGLELARLQLAGGYQPYASAPTKARWLAGLVRDLRRALVGIHDPDGGIDVPAPEGRPADASRWNHLRLVAERFQHRTRAPDRVVTVRTSHTDVAIQVAGRLVGPVARPSDHLAQCLAQRGAPTIPELVAALAGEATTLSRDTLLAFGEAAFDWLVPGDLRAEVMTAVAGGGHPHPASEHVRLVLTLGDADLEALPWRLVAYDGRFLQHDGGWTVELRSPGVVARTRVDLGVPEQVLLVAPRMGDDAGLAVDWFVATLTKRLESAWRTPAENFLRIVRTRDEVLNPRAVRPSLVIVHAPLTVHQGQLRALVDGPGGGAQRLGLAELAEVAPSAKMLVLDGPSHEPPPVSRAITERWPVVAVRGPSGTPWQQAYATLDWLEAIVDAGCDPIAATAHHPVSSETALARATMRVYTGYDLWHTQRMATGEARVHALKEVDRKSQRANAWNQIRDLAAGDVLRVLNLVAFGGEGEHIEWLGRQIDQHVRTELARGRDLVVTPFEVELDFAAPTFDDSLWNTLGGADPARFLTERARRHRAQGRRTVFLLDWGTLDLEAHGRPVLGAWARFAHTHLVALCPEDARIVSFLAVKCEADHDADLQDDVIDAEPPSPTPGVAVQAGFLPRLGPVSRQDLETYLAQPECSCPKTEIKAVARALHTQTQRGAFARVIDAIAAAERDGWRALVNFERT